MKNILFVCIENSCRSQMAQGLAQKFGQDIVIAYSAGSKPSGQVNPQAIKIMKEIDIDISQNKSKGFDSLGRISFDYVISMGCGDVCPFVPGKWRYDWKIIDPKNKGEDFFRKVRDEIKANVLNLLEEIRRK